MWHDVARCIRMTFRHKDIQTYRDTDIRTYRHAGMWTRRHTDIRTYGRTRQRTTRDVVMTMPMDTGDIDAVTGVDDDDEKDLSIQIRRHADMQIGTRPDIQACRGTQRIKAMKTHPREAILGLKWPPDGRKAALTFQRRQKGAFWGGSKIGWIYEVHISYWKSGKN